MQEQQCTEPPKGESKKSNSSNFPNWDWIKEHEFSLSFFVKIMGEVARTFIVWYKASE